MTDVWLVRHGEVASYMGDHGLTDRGVAQARQAAAELAAELRGEAGGGTPLGGGDAPAAGPGAPAIELRHAPSGRARGTAEALGAALAEQGVTVDDAGEDRGFENFRSVVDGVAGAHDRMRPRLAEIRTGDDTTLPAWAREVARFADIHDHGGDPIEWWLKQPTLALEPAALVVRRFWRALVALTAPRVVVCTHSGSMRALAAHAIGLDPGEPLHLERVHVRLDGDRATLAYRGQRVAMTVPDTQEPAWD